MLPTAQEASDYEANPFAAEQAERDETVGFMWQCARIESKEKNRLATRTHRSHFMSCKT